MNRPAVFILVTIVVVLICWWGILQGRQAARPQTGTSLVTIQVYCASGMVEPLTLAARRYRTNTGRSVDVQIVRSGGSGELAGQLATEFQIGLPTGVDLVLLADENRWAELEEQGIVGRVRHLMYQSPVIAVRQDSGHRPDSLDELLQDPSVRFGIASSQAAIGAVTRHYAKQRGLGDELDSRTKTEAENVMMLAQSLVTGSLDAAILWDTTVAEINRGQRRPVVRVSAPLDTSGNSRSPIGAAIVRSTDVPESAEHLVNFLKNDPEAVTIWKNYGYQLLAESTPGTRYDHQPVRDR